MLLTLCPLRPPGEMPDSKHCACVPLHAPRQGGVACLGVRGRNLPAGGKKGGRHPLLPTVTPNPLGSPPKILPESTTPVFLMPASPIRPGKLRGDMVFGVVGRRKAPSHPQWGGGGRDQVAQKAGKGTEESKKPNCTYQLSWSHQQWVPVMVGPPLTTASPNLSSICLAPAASG